MFLHFSTAFNSIREDGESLHVELEGGEFD